MWIDECCYLMALLRDLATAALTGALTRAFFLERSLRLPCPCLPMVVVALATRDLFRG